MHSIDPISLMSVHRSGHSELLAATQAPRQHRIEKGLHHAFDLVHSALLKARSSLTPAAQGDVCCAAA